MPAIKRCLNPAAAEEGLKGKTSARLAVDVPCDHDGPSAELEMAQLRRANTDLESAQRFMHSLIDSLPQSILRKDLTGRFTFANLTFCQIVGKPIDQILGRTDYDLFPVELATKFRRDDERVIASGKPFETVEENQNAAQEKVYVHVIKTPLFDAQGRAEGIQAVFSDVTERYRAQESVDKLNKQLMLTSRQAGMAEVATSVLHNVGNVLNSINVSTSIISSRLRQSKIANLAKASDLLRAHQEHLGEYLSADPKGRALPNYLQSLAEHLAAEHKEVLQEMELLNKNVEHVKEIVAMQQSYAKVCGVTEKVNVADLVEDAIHLNLGAFERHGIGIVREFAEVGPLWVDRHKVLQILVNLMRNAKYAIDELGPAEKRLVIRIEPKEEGVVIRICDNGIGIPRENLERIFSHGFTTKHDGHGFGLHSGALAAKDLGGKLVAESAGPGQGATFSLELPSAPPSLKTNSHAK